MMMMMMMMIMIIFIIIISIIMFALKREKGRSDVTQNITAIPSKMRVWHYTIYKKTARI